MEKNKTKQKKKSNNSKKAIRRIGKDRKGKEFLVSSLQTPRQMYGALLIEVNSN